MPTTVVKTEQEIVKELNSVQDTDEVKQQIYKKYEAKFCRLFKSFLREKENTICQCCEIVDCPRVAKNLERAIEMMLQEVSIIAKKRGKNNSDKIAQMVFCALAPIEAVGSELDVLHDIRKETATMMIRVIIKHIEERLKEWKEKYEGERINDDGSSKYKTPEV